MPASRPGCTPRAATPGSILSSALLAVLLGHGTDHAGALFAVTTATALLAAALALRLDSPDPVPVAIAGVARP